MASIKVSELPALTVITPNDVLILNDEDATTSKITISNFTTSFIGQNLPFTGIVNFGGVTTFGTGSNPAFNSEVTFNQKVVFNGPIDISASSTGIALGTLSDVTLPGSITDGNILTWDADYDNGVGVPAGQWVSASPAFSEISQDTTPTLGGNLDTNNFDITGPSDANIEVAPVGTGKFVVKGETTAQVDASITLNCWNNNHGVTIKSPPHASASVYTLILPDNMGSNGQVLSTNGTSETSWISVATGAQGAKADSALQPVGSAILAEYADNAAAKTGGLSNGDFYRNGDVVQQVHS